MYVMYCIGIAYARCAMSSLRFYILIGTDHWIFVFLSVYTGVYDNMFLLQLQNQIFLNQNHQPLNIFLKINTLQYCRFCGRLFLFFNSLNYYHNYFFNGTFFYIIWSVRKNRMVFEKQVQRKFRVISGQNEPRIVLAA